MHCCCQNIRDASEAKHNIYKMNGDKKKNPPPPPTPSTQQQKLECIAISYR
eukprot:m.47576 g.47576  ORF g.47576 m.47576 type:complete len:51 (+) comp7341_c0_seq2:754-906(+)